MVLSEKVVESKFGAAKGLTSYRTMVLDTEHIRYGVDKLKFGWGVELLNQINMISWANKLYDDMGSDWILDCSILHESIDAVFMEKPFNDDQLRSFFKLAQEIDDFLSTISKWHDIDTYCFPFELEYFLLGMPIDKMDEDNLNALSEEYGDLFCDVRMKKIEIDDFIKKAKGLIDSIVMNG